MVKIQLGVSASICVSPTDHLTLLFWLLHLTIEFIKARILIETVVRSIFDFSTPRCKFYANLWKALANFLYGMIHT